MKYKLGDIYIALFSSGILWHGHKMNVLCIYALTAEEEDFITVDVVFMM